LRSPQEILAEMELLDMETNDILQSIKGIDMKEGWKIKKLGEIGNIKGGKRVPKGYSLQKEPTLYPYIRVTDFNDEGTINF
jgi:restriction endonuclease S subunit